MVTIKRKVDDHYEMVLGFWSLTGLATSPTEEQDAPTDKAVLTIRPETVNSQALLWPRLYN